MQTKHLCVLIHIWTKGETGATFNWFKPSSNIFYWPCLFIQYRYVPCGHLLGKGWPLGSRLWCLTVSLSLSHWYPGSGVVLDCIDSWSLHSYLLVNTWLLMEFCKLSEYNFGLLMEFCKLSEYKFGREGDGVFGGGVGGYISSITREGKCHFFFFCFLLLAQF